MYETAPMRWDNSFYNVVLHCARHLFPGSVKVDERGIILIHDRVTIMLNLSWNENKVYIDTYNDCRESFQRKGYAKFTRIDDKVCGEMSKNNATFRLFDIESIITYLEMKAQENGFIKHNEG